ncbi:iron ABC transporter permease [Pseudonocardia xishanensis]|uniref:ABC transporter permease n=1 Tax=Pseudonocardia xishanensis TaxID=630995 RepID=UPI0031E6A1B4
MTSAHSTERATGDGLRRLVPVRGARSARPFVAVLCVLALVLFVWPVAMLAIGAFRTSAPGVPGEWSAQAVPAVLSDPRTWSTLLQSAALAVTVTAVGVVLGFFLAWVVTRTDAPLRRVVTPMMMVVFAVPLLFSALSWGMLAQPPNGTLNTAVAAVSGADTTWLTAYSWFGLIGTTALKVTAVAYLLLSGPVGAMDRSLTEASSLAGARRWTTFWRVEVPVLAPAVAGVAILCLVLGLGLLDVALVLGVPAGISVFPTEIYGYLMTASPPEYARAGVLALVLVVIVLLLVAAQNRVLAGREFVTVTGKARAGDVLPLGRARWACTAVVVGYGLVAVVLPFLQLVLGSLQPVFGVYGTFTLDNYLDVLDDRTVLEALSNTLLLGVVAGFVATLLAALISYARLRTTAVLRTLPDLALWLIIAVPGVVVSLGVLWAYLSTPVLGGLYGTVWIVVLALVALVTPIAARATSGAVVQIGPELEDAARTAGASQARTVVDVVLRLILPAFLGAWFVTGVLAAGNLDIPVLLASPSTPTVPTIVYSLYSQTGQTAQAAAVLCVFLASLAAVFVLLLALRASVSALLRRATPQPNERGGPR